MDHFSGILFDDRPGGLPFKGRKTFIFGAPYNGFPCIVNIFNALREIHKIENIQKKIRLNPKL